jgi:3-hydroxyacyl-[acyl-carrier-protein] dehydratase
MTSESAAAPTPTAMDPFALLPHRFPFLLLDTITVLEPGRRVAGTKAVTGGESSLIGPGAHGRVHAMPHVLIVEALAQLSAAILVALLEGKSGAIGYFIGIDRVRFRSEAMPGDILDLSVELRQFRRGICRSHGVARVGAERIVQADLTTILRS